MWALISGPSAFGAIYFGATSDGGTRANLALVLGIVAGLGTLYGIFDRERTHREGSRRRRKR